MPKWRLVSSGFGVRRAEACLQLHHHAPHQASKLIVHLDQLQRRAAAELPRRHATFQGVTLGQQSFWVRRSFGWRVERLMARAVRLRRSFCRNGLVHQLCGCREKHATGYTLTGSDSESLSVETCSHLTSRPTSSPPRPGLEEHTSPPAQRSSSPFHRSSSARQCLDLYAGGETLRRQYRYRLVNRNMYI